MTKLMAPNIRIDWYPEGHFTQEQYPQPHELSSGYNLSPAIVTGFKLDFTDSNTVEAATIYDNHSSELFTHSSYEANLQFFLAPRRSNADNEAAYRIAEQLFYTEGPKTGYLVKRFGYKWDTPYEMDHKIDVFKVQSTTPKVVAEDGAPILLDVVFLPVGDAYNAADGFLPFPQDNLVRNGDFENGLTHWTSRQVDEMSTTPAWNNQMWGGLGGNMLYVAATQETILDSYFRQNIHGNFILGKYLGISGYFATPGDGSVFRVRVRWGSRGTYSYSGFMEAPFYGGSFSHHAFRIPQNLDLIQFQVDISTDWVGDGLSSAPTQFWADKIMVALGNTEEEALENSAVYRPHKEEL